VFSVLRTFSQGLGETRRITLWLSVSDLTCQWPWRSTQRLLLRQRQLGRPGKISSCFQTSLLIRSQNLLRRNPRLRTVLAQSLHGHHLQDWLISVSPDNRRTYRTVIAAKGSVVSGPGLAASIKRATVARRNLSASALVNRSFPPPHRAAPPDTRIAVLCPSAIGKMAAVSDELPPSVARQPVYSVSIRLLVYIVKVSGKITRSALPLFVPLHSTCDIGRLPYHIFPNSHSNHPMMSQIEKKIQTARAALAESPPDRFESACLSGKYKTYGMKS
jgi:hypothetical protein